MPPEPSATMNEQNATSLLVILICPNDRWAGPPRNQGATAPTPEPKTCQNNGTRCPQRSFQSRRRYPKLHSGPSTQRMVPYQNDAHNQQPQNKRNDKSEREWDHGKAHNQDTIGCPQLHRAHTRLLAPGKPRLHHPE
ncbi:hypothetical protein ARTHRO9AX_220250 [Arthrobacter sp. 9AX]|nr:hypothetical protein ARTHRO9AX_220250 [Arthrobacter sp. 9AX]